MRTLLYVLFMLCSLVFTQELFATEDLYNYQFNSDAQQTRFYQLTHELRCLVCQNETLADSNAPLAKDLRQKIAQQILAGSSDQDILNYLIQRYGEFILYKPRFISINYLLWVAPLLFLMIGILLWWRISRSARLNQIKL